MNYRPSGRMCVACCRAKNNCSDLNFSSMRKMKTDTDGTVVVRCQSFEHNKESK